MSDTNIQLTPEVLETALAAYLGVERQDVKPTIERLIQSADTVEQISPVVTEQWRSQQLQSLRDAWGDEFDGVYSHITEKVFPTLSPQDQAKYNNADGLRFLAEKHRSTIEQALQSNGTPDPSAEPTTPAPGSITPQGQGGGGATTTSPTFKQSQLLAMSPEEWSQNEQAIQQAYSAGAVVQDVE